MLSFSSLETQKTHESSGDNDTIEVCPEKVNINEFTFLCLLSLLFHQDLNLLPSQFLLTPVQI